jgi:hypothetical protein
MTHAALYPLLLSITAISGYDSMATVALLLFCYYSNIMPVSLDVNAK